MLETEIVFSPRTPKKVHSAPHMSQHFSMHETVIYSHRHEQVLFDESNPRSLVRLVPPALAHEMRKLRQSVDAPLLLGLTDPAMRLELQRRGRVLAHADVVIRFRFWVDYDRIQAEEPRPDPINMGYVLGLDMAKETFYRYYITDPVNLAFFICRPETFEEIRTLTTTAAMKRLQEFCETPGAGLREIARVLAILRTLKVIPSRAPKDDAPNPAQPEAPIDEEYLLNDPTAAE